MKNNRVQALKIILWLIAGSATTSMIFRLIKGLGASTNLTDNTPWGLWIGFDVFSGVALAAGGFVICAVVYIFHLEKYRSLVRPAVLTAFLGYVAVAVGLFFDLGVPWHIWHPTIYWQHHSALFEVAWCVMLYLTVLLLEFSPAVLEKMTFGPFPTILKYLKRFTIVFVLLGIMLSVLHQSSLGTLFLLLPSRIHPLWYSSIQPLLFFISAVALGMSMVITESLVTSWLYRRKSEIDILQKLARVIPGLLVLYLLLRLGELYLKQNLLSNLTLSWESTLFITELLISVVIPSILFIIPRIRKSGAGLLFASFMVVFGFVLNRIDVSIISSFTVTGTIYIPTLIEIMTSLGIISMAVIAFLYFADNYSIYPVENEAIRADSVVPADRLFTIVSGDERRFSLAYILGVFLMIFLLPDGAFSSLKPEQNPVRKAINMDIETITLSASTMEQFTGTTEVLLIDGNRSRLSTLFMHGRHIKREGGNTSCGICHHLNLPNERASECAYCHRDMYLESDIFSHTMHIKEEKGNAGCQKCHKNSAVKKNRETSVPCRECHDKMKIDNSFIQIQSSWKGFATGYKQAMHGLCLKCHEQKEKAAGKKFRMGISGCATCHKDSLAPLFIADLYTNQKQYNEK